MTSRGTWIGVGTVLAIASVALVGWSVSRYAPDAEAVTREPAEPIERGVVERAPLTTSNKTVAPSGPISTETTRAPAKAEDGELAEAIWVEGRVFLPAGTPSDERVEILARGERFETMEYHRVPLEPDGSFRVAFHPRTGRGRLGLEARYVHLTKPRRLNFSRLSRPLAPITLRPSLGAWVTGVLLPPGNLQADDAWPESIEMVLEFSGTNGARRERKGNAQLEQGVFTFDFGAVPKERTFEIVARPPAWLPARKKGRKLEVAEHRRVELQLRLGAQVHGRVVDEQGEGVKSSIRVTSTPNEAGGLSRTSSTASSSDEDGCFSMNGIAPGRVTVVAGADGFLSVPLELGMLDDGDRTTDVTLRVGRGLSITGRVVWPDGTPAPDATVVLRRGNRFTGTVEADGRFTFTGLSPGTVRVDASAAPPLSADGSAHKADELEPQESQLPWRASVEVDSGTSNVLLVLDPGATLHGTVVDEDGRPINNFAVSLRPEGSWDRSRSERFHGANGSFSIEGMHDGEWRITARGTEHSSGPPVRVTIAGGDARVDLCSFNQAGIAGRILDGEGQPVQKATVRTTIDSSAHGVWGEQSKSTQTAKNGSFELYGLPPGTVELEVQKAGYLGAHVMGLELQPGELRSGIRLVLSDGGAIEGRLRGLPDGLNARVRLRPTNSDYTDAVGVDRDGSFAFAQVAADTYQVVLIVDGRPPTSVEATVMGGETAYVVLDVSTSGLVRVHGVVRRRSKGVPGVDIDASGADANAQARSDAEGRYELFIAPGEVLFLISEFSVFTALDATIPETTEFHLDLELPEGSLRGSVVRGQGGSGTGVLIKLTSEWGTHESTTFGSDFRFDDIGPGVYRVEARTAGDVVQRQVSAPVTVELAENQVLDGIELVLGDPASIEGYVTDSAGQPVIGKRVYASPTGDGPGAMHRAATDNTGYYRFRGLGPADWTVRVTIDGAFVGRSSTKLTAGDEARVDVVVTSPP